MERTFATDRDWTAIDGQLCLVTSFAPLAKVADGKVIAINPTTPYGSVHLKCEKSPDNIIGFITHKTDFMMLWAAFNEPTEVDGTRVEVRSSELNSTGLGEGVEVWLVWTQRRYRRGVGLFRKILPRLIVMVSPRGAFDLLMDRTKRPDLKGEARAIATLPLATWTPKVMT